MFNIIISEQLRGNQIAYFITHKTNSQDLQFSQIEVLVPNKVIRFTFNDGVTIKTICNEKDVFSFRDAFFVALAKYLSMNQLTPEGVSKFAEQLKYYKLANKLVERGMRLYERQIQAEEKKKVELAEKKAAAARKREKKLRYNKRKEDRLSQKIANEIKKISCSQ